jgi:hypothetical protein
MNENPEEEDKRINLAERVESFYERADKVSGGILGIMRGAVEGFGEANASQAAAGMAYTPSFRSFHCCWPWLSLEAFSFSSRRSSTRSKA